MQHAVQTHEPSAPAALSPRELEANLLLTAAARKGSGEAQRLLQQLQREGCE